MNWNLTLPLLVAINLALLVNPAFAFDRKEQEAQAIERVLERLGEGTPQQILARLISNKASTWGQSGKTDALLSGVAAKALGFFERIEGRNFDDYLKRVRLPKVSETFKAQVLANLAGGEEVRPSARMQAKLVGLESVLRYHERDTAIEVRVINLRQAFVGLQGRAVLLISDKALDLLKVEELQATVAHEMAHEYFWGEYQEARQRQQYERMREIELLCDGIAVITLKHLKLDCANLISAVDKINSFNARVVNTDKLPYPSPDERFKFIRALAEMVKVRAPAMPALARQ